MIIHKFGFILFSLAAAKVNCSFFRKIIECSHKIYVVIVVLCKAHKSIISWRDSFSYTTHTLFCLTSFVHYLNIGLRYLHHTTTTSHKLTQPAHRHTQSTHLHNPHPRRVGVVGWWGRVWVLKLRFFKISRSLNLFVLT